MFPNSQPTQDELSRLLVRDGGLEDAVSLQRSVAEAKIVLYGDPSEQAAASYQMLGSIKLKQGRTQQALKWLTKVIHYTMFGCIVVHY